MAREILRLQDVAFLIALKLFGTSLVLAFLVAYSSYNRAQAHVIAGSVALFQVAILVYILAS